jgi:O-antigen/teichoic acid export membrane protein
MSPESAHRFPLLRRTLVLAAGQSAVTFIEFAAVVLLVRYLEPSVWTVVAVALTAYQTAIGIGGLNIQDGIYFFYSKAERSQRRGVVLQTATMLLASGLLMAALVLLAGPWVRDVSVQALPLLPWIALTVVLELPTSCTAQALIAAERTSWASAYSTAMSALKVACLAIPLILGFGLEQAAQGLALHAILRVLISGIVLVRAVPPGPLRIQLQSAKEQLVYTAPLALSMGSTVLNRYVDKWIVAALVPTAFGAYAFAAQEVPLVPVLGNAIGTVLATRITHAFQIGDLDRARAYWLAATSRVALVVGPLTVGLVLCAPEAVHLFFEDTYAIAVLPFQIYSAILLHRIMAYGLILRAAGKPRTLWFASLLLLGMNVAFSIPLTYLFGLPGTAAGTLIAFAVNLVFFLHCIANVMNVRVRDVYPWSRYGRILGCALLCALLGWYASTLVASLGAKLLTKAALFAGLYLVVSRLLAVARNLPEVPADHHSFTALFSSPQAAAAGPVAPRAADGTG